MTETSDLADIANWPVEDLTGDKPTEVPALGSWNDIELVAVGEWSLSTGIANFTSLDLQEACAAARCPAVGQPVIKIGHTDPRFAAKTGDGEPAIGWVANMHLNDTQTKAVGDFTGMPGWLAAILPSAYPERSIEASFDFTCQIGHKHPFVITAVALLGVTPPGVGAIASLNDVAALYGITVPAEPEPDPAAAAARPFTLHLPGGPMPQPQAQAAGVVPTVDDIRREFYEAADWSQWIVEVQVTPDGPVLIVIDDDDGDLSRIPVMMPAPADAAGKPTFGEATKVLVSYVDAPPDPDDDDSGPTGGDRQAAAFPAGRKVAGSWGSRKASRAGVLAAAIPAHTTPTDPGTWDGTANQTALPTEEGTSADYRKAYAWVDPDGDADTKAAYKFNHHFVADDGTVGAASTVACTAAIGVLNGGRGGADVPDDDVAGIFAHMAKHLTDAGLTPPELSSGSSDTSAAALEDDPDVAGAQKHGATTETHEHPHADGSGGTHFHAHTHNGDATHQHHTADEADAEAGAPAPQTGRGSDMEFSTEQLAGFRKTLGLPDDAEVTAEEIAAAVLRAGQAPPTAPVGEAPVITAAAADLPEISDGSYLVDGEIIKNWQNRAAAGDEATRRMMIAERDHILAEAVRKGKFPQSRLDHYAAMWDKDPDGTRKYVDALAAGLVPMGGPAGTNPGYDPDMPGGFEGQSAYATLYPDDANTRGIGSQAGR